MMHIASAALKDIGVVATGKCNTCAELYIRQSLHVANTSVEKKRWTQNMGGYAKVMRVKTPLTPYTIP